MTTDRNSGIPKVQATAPERINLTITDEEYARDEPFPYGEEVCWAADEPVSVCVPYARADLAIPAAEVQALVERMRLAQAMNKGERASVYRICADELAKLIPRNPE